MGKTKPLVPILEVEKVVLITWYIDPSYAIHDDCKGHTGRIMTMGKGTLTSFSREHKIKAMSSTKAVLVGADGIIPQAL